jgi:hypothetical protein
MFLPARSLSPPVTLLLVVLTGCKLIDQTTFAPSPSRNPNVVRQPAAAPTPVARVDTRTPLAVIDQNTPVTAYTSVLHAAVQAASARDSDVNFDVTVVVPAQGNPVQALTQVQSQATQVMHVITDAGIPDDRVHLRAAADPSLHVSQIRVYVS